MTRDLGSIDRNEFITGLQEEAVKSGVIVTAGVHLPTHSGSHVSPLALMSFILVCKYRTMDKPVGEY